MAWQVEDERETPSETNITLDEYNNLNISLRSEDTKFVDQFKGLVGSKNNIVEIPSSNNVDDFVLASNASYFIGANFEKSVVTGFYSYDFFHSPPIILNLINQAILRSYSGSDYSITVSKHPYMYHHEYYMGYDAHYVVYLIMYASMWIVASILFSSVFVFYLKNKTSGAKVLQFNYGLSRITYWATALVIDMAVCYTMCVLLLYGVANTVKIFLFVLHFVSFMYILSLVFKKSSYFKIFVLVINILAR